VYDAILFDLDGTIVDSTLAHAEAWARAMEELGKKVSPEEKKRYIELEGQTLEGIMKGLYGDVDPEFLKRLKEAKNRHFREMGDLIKVKIPWEVFEALKKKYKVGVVTSASRDAAKWLLSLANVDDLLDVLITWEDVKEGKPSPEGILKAMERIGTRRVLYVGDTEYDREAARRAGVDYMDVEEFVRSWKSLL